MSIDPLESLPYAGPFPPPQRMRIEAAGREPLAPVRVVGAVELEPERRWLEEELETRGLLASSGSGGQSVSLSLAADSTTRPQGYRLELGEGAGSIVGHDEAGLRYGSLCLLEVLDQARARGESLPTLAIEDWPDFAQRGVMLDVSRDRVPTMKSLLALVDELARWRINQLQLYMEHTFAYRGHEAVWSDASPFTAEEIRELDRFCRARHVELVPNQNCLGHFHRWLVHEPYRRLAECPEGFVTVFTPEGEPYSLCPTDPASLALLEDLFDQLLPNFSSALVNVGLDETFDVGQGRSAEACAERGAERVYLEFLLKVHALLRARGHRMQFWGDIILKRPELIRELPRDAIALEWGYEADHPFAEDSAHFAAAGLEFYLCPGTSSWNSIGGRTDNALRNLANASRNGRGASGFLITDWGDHGHWQPHPIRYFGLLAGAAFAWNRGAAAHWAPRDGAAISVAQRAHWCALLDRLVFRDTAGELGAVAFDLGTAGLVTGARNRNGSPLFRFFHYADRPWPHPEIEGLTGEGLTEAEALLDALRPRLARTRSTRADQASLRAEFAWAIDLLALAARLGRARLQAGAGSAIHQIDDALRHTMAEELNALAARHRELWLARDRQGGLIDSIARFARLARLLAA